MLIFTHELGHFTVAKLCHIKVNEFAIGMGPAIFKIKRGETIYALRVLPIGGFCAMEGEDSDSTDEGSFGSKPVWKRILVVIAGALTNIITGFILIIIYTSVFNSALPTTVIAKFEANATSNAIGGMKVGDRIMSINGSRIHVYSDITYDLVLDSDGCVNMQVKRAGAIVNLKNVRFPMISDGNGGKVMQRDFWVFPERKTFLSVMHESIYGTVSLVRLVWMTFISLFTGRFGLKDLAGPIGVTASVGQAASMGIDQLLYIAAMIAVNLGVVNLFPLPALDGGRLLFLIVEGIRRKPVNPKYEGYVHFVGFALLMLLMVVVSFNDVVRLLKG